LAQVVDQEQAGLPTTLKREAKTTVVIKDGHTVVIGGLIDETLSQTTYKVPCLGNIPLFGWLFKSKSDDEDRTNLFIFITPHIVENPMEANVIYEEKKEQIESVRMKEGVIKMYEKPAPEDKETETDETEAVEPEGEKTEMEQPGAEEIEAGQPEGEKIETKQPEGEEIEAGQPEGEKIETEQPGGEEAESEPPEPEKMESEKTE
jgi:general secretion pathway protein D